MLDFEKYVDASAAAMRSLGVSPVQTQIDAVNAQHTDFELPPIPDDQILPGGRNPIGPPYPLIESAVPSFDLTAFSVGQHDADATPAVAIRIWHQDVEYPRLWRALNRYTSCVLVSLREPGAFGGGITIQSVRGGFAIDPESGERTEITASSLLVYALDDVGLASILS